MITRLSKVEILSIITRSSKSEMQSSKFEVNYLTFTMRAKQSLKRFNFPIFSSLEKKRKQQLLIESGTVLE